MSQLSLVLAAFSGASALGVVLVTVGLILHDEGLWLYIDAYILAAFGASAVVFAVARSRILPEQAGPR